MTDMQRWLMRARGINEKIDALDELIELTKARAEGSGSKGGGGGSRKPGGFEKVMAQIETYEHERSEIERIRDEVYDAICTLADKRWQTALIRFYITTQEWQDIADRMGVDRRTVTRWHGRALMELEKNFLKCPTMSHDVLECPADNGYNSTIGSRAGK